MDCVPAGSLGITDSLDRVKLLQQITTMQADLASLASPARRWRGSGKFRRFSENSPAYRTVAIPSRRMSTDEAKPVHTLAASRSRSRPSVLDAYLEQWSRSRAQFPRKLSSSSGTVYSDAGTSQSVIGMSQSDVGASHSESTLAHAVTRTAHSDVGPPRSRSAQGREEGVGAPLRRKTSHLKEKKKRLSRSVDKLWEVCYMIQDQYHAHAAYECTADQFPMFLGRGLEIFLGDFQVLCVVMSSSPLPSLSLAPFWETLYTCGPIQHLLGMLQRTLRHADLYKLLCNEHF